MSLSLKAWLLRWRVWAGLFALPLGAVAVFVLLPLPEHLLDYRPVASLRILDRQGNLLHEFLSRDDGRAVPIAPGEVSPTVRAAFIAAEDHTFYTHHGIAARGVARALWVNVRAGRVVEGGSTLTQQLARQLVPRPRSWVGKVQEALWALRLEAHLSKDEILSHYLNRISFGSGTFGIEAASKLYFGRPANALSLAQAAALASLPRGPSAYHPIRHPDRLRKRQDWVLQRMVELKLVSSDDARLAQQESLDLTAFTAAFRAPHFVQFVARHLAEWGLAEASEVQTTLDARLQRELEEAVEVELAALHDRQAHQAAALILDNETGEVLAYVGARDFFDDENAGQYDGVQLRRQPGSALKPLIYAKAMDTGVTPATVLSDTPAAFDAPAGAYHPQNYNLRYRGPVRVREALANSLNVPAVRLAERLGPEKIRWTLRQAGFDSLSQPASYYGLGLALGNGEVTLWELARAYLGLARGGRMRPLTAVLFASTVEGKRLAVRPERPEQRFVASSSAALVTDILADPSARAGAFGLDNVLRFSFPAAAKTGTSKNFADNWSVGYTHERTAAVWVGNFDRTAMRQVSGVTGAGPLFHRALTMAMRDLAPRPLVSVNLSRVDICPLSGALATEACPHHMEERFKPGTEPQERCAMHHRTGAGEILTDVGPEFYAWAARTGHKNWQGPQDSKRPSDRPRLLSPRPGDSFVLLDDLPISDQAIPLRAVAAAAGSPLEVRLDGQRIFEFSAPFVGRLPATPGPHVVTLHRPGEPEAWVEARYRVAFKRSTVQEPPVDSH